MQMKQTKRGREDKEKREAGNNFWGEKGEGESALLAVAERKLIYAWCSVIGRTIFIYIYIYYMYKHIHRVHYMCIYFCLYIYVHLYSANLVSFVWYACRARVFVSHPPPGFYLV